MQSNSEKDRELALKYFFLTLCPLERGVAILQKEMKVNTDVANQAYSSAIPIFVTKVREGKVKKPESIDAFFITIAKFEIRNYWRSKGKNANHWEVFDPKFVDGNDQALSGEELMIEKEEHKVANEVLSGLSENCRKLLPYYYENHSHKEIAAKFDFVKNEPQSKVQVFRCRQKFFTLLRKHSKYKEIFGNES